MSGTPSELEKEEDAAENFFSKTLKVAAYPISALVGYSFTAPVIRNAAYDNLKHHDAFKDIHPPHRNGLLDIVHRFHKGEPVDVVNETIKLHKAYELHSNARLQEMGLGTLRKKWQFIYKSQKQNALLTGFTAAGITLGALLTAANSKTITALTSMDSGTER